MTFTELMQKATDIHDVALVLEENGGELTISTGYRMPVSGSDDEPLRELPKDPRR